MKKVHISFGDEKYKKSLDLLGQTTLEIGKVVKLIAYRPQFLETDFFAQKNAFILSRPRGAGYWIWKPFIILKTFENLEIGDAVLYTDAGLKVISDLSPLFELLKNEPNGGKIIFKVPEVRTTHKAKKWTKRDCFVLTDCDEEKYWNAPMTNGAVSLWIKNEENEKFLREWQKYLRDPRIVTDDVNMCGRANFLDFVDHRHDQSVLTILCAKYNFELFRDPTQWGKDEVFPNSPYPQLFHHHRNFKH